MRSPEHNRQRGEGCGKPPPSHYQTVGHPEPCLSPTLAACESGSHLVMRTPVRPLGMDSAALALALSWFCHDTPSSQKPGWRVVGLRLQLCIEAESVLPLNNKLKHNATQRNAAAHPCTGCRGAPGL